MWINIKINQFIIYYKFVFPRLTHSCTLYVSWIKTLKRKVTHIISSDHYPTDDDNMPDGETITLLFALYLERFYTVYTPLLIYFNVLQSIGVFMSLCWLSSSEEATLVKIHIFYTAHLYWWCINIETNSFSGLQIYLLLRR